MKVIFIIEYMLCRILYRINHRIYMKFFLSYIKKRRVAINGTPRYIGVNVKFDDYSLIEIGDKSTISDGCHLLTHDYSITNVMRAVGNVFETDLALIRGIKIGNNCFIGKKSIILPNTEIGDDCVIGAGSVIRGKIPSQSVVIGNPAKVICSVQELAEKWSLLLKEGKCVRFDK